MGAHVFTFVCLVFAYGWYIHKDMRLPTFFDTANADYDAIYRIWTETFIIGNNVSSPPPRRHKPLRAPDSESSSSSSHGDDSSQNGSSDSDIVMSDPDSPTHMDHSGRKGGKRPLKKPTRLPSKKSGGKQQSSKKSGDKKQSSKKATHGQVLFESHQADPNDPPDFDIDYAPNIMEEIGALDHSGSSEENSDTDWLLPDEIEIMNAVTKQEKTMKKLAKPALEAMDTDEPSGFVTATDGNLTALSSAERSQNDGSFDSPAQQAPMTSTPACKVVQVQSFNVMELNEGLLARVSTPEKNFLYFANPLRESPINQATLHMHPETDSSSDGEEVSKYFGKKRKKKAQKDDAKRSKGQTRPSPPITPEPALVPAPPVFPSTSLAYPQSPSGVQPSLQSQTYGSFRLFLEDSTRVESPAEAVTKLSGKERTQLLKRFKNESPWFRQFRNIGNSCWFGSPSLSLIWSLKSINAQLPPPPLNANIQDWTFQDHFFNWYHSDGNRTVIDPTQGLEQFIRDYYIDEDEPVRNQMRHAQQTADLVPLHLLIEDTFKQFTAKFRETMVTEKCTSDPAKPGQLCTEEYKVPVEKDVDDPLFQVSLKKKGKEDLNTVVQQHQDDVYPEIACEKCKQPVKKKMEKRMINDPNANLLIINLKRTMHDDTTIRPVYSEKREVMTFNVNIIKNNNEVDVPMEISVIDEHGDQVTFQLVSVVEHLGEQPTGGHYCTHIAQDLQNQVFVRVSDTDKITFSRQEDIKKGVIFIYKRVYLNLDQTDISWD